MASPKYIDIFEQLRTRCQSLATGVKFPPERALAEEFSVSVMTMRHALSLLVDQGWVQRTAGSGTFVSRPTIFMGPSLTSFTQDMTARGFTPSSRVLRAEMVTPDLVTIKRLSLRPGAKAFLLERLRSADGEPMCHEVALFPEHIGKLFHKVNLEGSIHGVLASHDIVPRSTQRSVRTVMASDRECELLALPHESPALETVDVFSDTLGAPMQYARSRYRFDRYEVLTNIENFSQEG